MVLGSVAMGGEVAVVVSALEVVVVDSNICACEGDAIYKAIYNQYVCM